MERVTPDQQTMLFHVTPADNANSILRIGVNPSYSTGKLAVSWWVQLELVAWALAHVSYRKRIAVSSLAIALAPIPVALRVNTRWKGVYTVKDTVLVHKISSSYNYLSE